MAGAEQEPRAVVLGDGRRIMIRPVRPSDKQAIASAFDRLSPESRYRRFFAPLERLSERDLAYLTEVDHRDHEALVAYEARSGEPIGVARFVRWAEPEDAEVAVTVVDHWQGHGVGTALLERLVERAREEGVRRFLALIVDENERALDLAHRLAPDQRPPRRSASGHLELVVEIPGPGQGIGGRLRQLLREAARGLTINPWRVLRR